MNNGHDAHAHPRVVPLELSADEFRLLGHRLIDQIAGLLDGLRDGPVTPGEPPAVIRGTLGSDRLPEHGTPAAELLNQTTDLLFQHSLFNGHPRFWGYITSSAAPIGALGDLLAAAVNPNVGAFISSPMASEIEAQTIRWIAELIGYPSTCGGLLVSGGNVANFVALLAARKAKVPWDLASEGLGGTRPRLTVYVSRETHTWIHKASELFGMGAQSVRWIDTDEDLRMKIDVLQQEIAKDRAAGHLPIMVVGTAGTVGTGAVDPLPEIAAVCKASDLWFHVDGAYGAAAAALPEASTDLAGLRQADSIAMDPHKWLYSPLEAGCTLVRDPRHLIDAYSHHPVYYNFEGRPDEAPINYYEFGLQNSRGFRALKVWLGLRQAGREGYVQMIRDDIALAQHLRQAVVAHPELEALTQSLSITTFRFIPPGLRADTPEASAYLDQLNEELLNRLQAGGEAFVSNAQVHGKYALRACVVNFRTEKEDVEALPEIIVRLGRAVDQERRPKSLEDG
jgi:aromatic-L-amino-acid decarboxylase